MISGRTTVDGRFELIEPLGSGGMGTVWRAYDLALHREVALKEVRATEPDGMGAPGVHRERVLREARALARIGHPNVVAIHHIVDADADTHPWIVMELVRGRSLEDHLAAGPMPPAQVAFIGRGILGALRAAHAVGVLHRDVKPANVLLREDGSPVLTDFGIAAINGLNGLTSTGTIVGSLNYVAPERLSGQEGNPASDLWALGLVLYVAVEGYHPMRRDSDVATLAAVIRGEVPPPQRAGALTSTILSLLVPDPAQRPSAEQVDAMLAQAITGSHPVIGSFAAPHALAGPPAAAHEPYSSPAAHPGSSAAPPTHFGAPSHTPVGLSPGSHAPPATPSIPHAHSLAPASQVPGYAHAAPFGSPAADGSAAVPAVPALPPSSIADRRKRDRILLGFAAVAVTAMLVAAMALWTSSSGRKDNSAAPPPQSSEPQAATVPGQPKQPPPVAQTGPDLLTPEGIRQAVAALETAVGGNEFTETNFYSNYVNTGAPLRDQPSLYDEFTFRGGKATRKGPGGQLTEPKTVNLRALNWDALPGLWRTAEEKLGVPKPTLRYIKVDPAWTFNDDQPTLLLYLIDDYGGAYLAAGADGTVVSMYPRGR